MTLCAPASSRSSLKRSIAGLCPVMLSWGEGRCRSGPKDASWPMHSGGKHRYKGLKLAQLLGQFGVLLTWGVIAGAPAPRGGMPNRTSTARSKTVRKGRWAATRLQRPAVQNRVPMGNAKGAWRPSGGADSTSGGPARLRPRPPPRARRPGLAVGGRVIQTPLSIVYW
jgi:hypothetical protein